MEPTTNPNDDVNEPHPTPVKDLALDLGLLFVLCGFVVGAFVLIASAMGGCQMRPLQEDAPVVREKPGRIEGKKISALIEACKPNKGVDYYIMPPKLGVKCKNHAVFWDEKESAK